MGNLDPQSTDLGVKIAPTVKASWVVDVACPVPPHARNIYFKAVQSDGTRPRVGVKCFVAWPDGKHEVVTDGNGDANFPMGWNCPISRHPMTGKWGGGPYRAYIGEPAESEVVWGLGVPAGEAQTDWNLTFKAVQQSLQDRAIAVARQQHLMPINTGASLYKKAHDVLLWGDAQTDEFPFTFQGEDYVGQVFRDGLVYANKKNVNDVSSVKKPWPAA